MGTGMQRYEHVVVSGLAHVDATHAVTSASIEAELAPTMERLGMSKGVLEDLAGIAERRYWDVGVLPSDVAAMAGERVLADVAVRREDIGALINTSVCRDYLEPSTASIVHAKLGLGRDVVNFDLGNACLGFMNGMALIAGMIERDEIDHGLLVDGEGSRFIAEATIARLAQDSCDEALFRESFATLTLGSGAAAMLLSREGLAPGHPYRGGLARAATEHHALCRGHADDMRTDARALLLAGIAHAKDIYPEAAGVFGLSDRSVARYMVHQPSKVHLATTCDVLGLDIEKVSPLYPRYGNIGPAGIPTSLSKDAESGLLPAGGQIALLGIGSGLNAAIAEIVW